MQVMIEQPTTLETDFTFSVWGEILFPENVQQEFQHMLWPNDSRFGADNIAHVTIEFLFGRSSILHKHEFTFEGDDLHVALQGEVFKAMGDCPRQSRRVRITTAPEAAEIINNNINNTISMEGK